MITVKEAAETWGVADATIRQYVLAGKFHRREARKSGGTWLVTKAAMFRVFGPPKEKQ